MLQLMTVWYAVLVESECREGSELCHVMRDRIRLSVADMTGSCWHALKLDFLAFSCPWMA